LGVKVLGDHGVLGVEGAGLRKEGVGGCGLSQEAGFAGLLDELGDAILVGEDEGHGVVRIAGVELLGLGELGLGCGEVVVVEKASAVEVGVVGLLKLMFIDGVR
jgi:hypothetical protein